MKPNRQRLMVVARSQPDRDLSRDMNCASGLIIRRSGKKRSAVPGQVKNGLLAVVQDASVRGDIRGVDRHLRRILQRD